MMMNVIDFSKSVPSSFSQSALLPVIALPGSTILGQFGVSAGPNGLVLLEATLGLQNSLTNASDLIITIVRNAVQIFTARSSSLTGNSYEAIHLAFTDSGLPAGYYGYALTASAVSSVNPPTIIGPLVFSGLSVS
ncbi:hypothetical protein [Paenibacillus tritici]|nr:hypothetical protein [Paenibacillus tritici]